MVKDLDKKQIVGIILFIIYLLGIVIITRYVLSDSETVYSLSNASTISISIGVLASFLSVVLVGVMDVTCSRVFGIRIEITEAVAFTFVSAAINTFLPLQAGSVIKAYYYKKKSGLSYSKFVSVMAGTMILNMIINLVCALLSIVCVISRVDGLQSYIMPICIIMICLILVVFWANVLRDVVIRITPLKKQLLPIVNGYYELMGSQKTVLLCSLNMILRNLLGGVRFLSILYILGGMKDFPISLMYCCVTNVSEMIPILPGNIGISEGIVGVINNQLFSRFDMGVAAVLINRFFYYIALIIGAIIFSAFVWIVYRKTKKEM
ncbi:MAG: UPF0104 family protein [Lachnospiraceae bacterium]|jgi:uncharacterized protein (TIRG00374 family)|nr:UPF0104 family protein [Lachnospiraceae bacterium]